MRKIFLHINKYFIEMVKDEVARNALSERLSKSLEDRHEVSMPITRNVSDAFYVAFGCRFQDRPFLNLAISIGFLVAMGLLIAKLIVSYIQ